MEGMHTTPVCMLILVLFTMCSQSIEPENKAYDSTMKGESGDQGRELKGDDSGAEQLRHDGLPLSEQPSSQIEDDIKKVTDQLQELNVGPQDDDIDLSLRQTQRPRLEQAVKESQHPEPQKKALGLKERQSLEDDNDASTKGDESHENVSLGGLDVDVSEKLVISSEHADGSLQDTESVQVTHPDSQDRYPAFSDFTIENIIGDGNCFFRAVADQLFHRGFFDYGRILDHHDLRSMACDYLSGLPEEKKMEWREFLNEREYHGRRLEDYIDHMRRDGVYADEMIIRALARDLILQVVIYTNGERPIHIGSNAEQERTIYLHYQRNSPDSYSNHYESLHLNDEQGQEKHPTGLTHDEMIADRDGKKTVSKSKGYDSVPPFRTGDLNKLPNVDKNQFLRKSKKVLPPSQVLESEKSERIRDIVPRRDEVDGGTESCAVTVSSSSQSQTSFQKPALLSHYRFVTPIMSQNMFVQILQERSCPIHIAVSRNIFSVPYFHHFIVRAVSKYVIEITVAHSGCLTFREILASSHLGSVHESKYIVSGNGEAPENLSYFDFDKGVYIIDDFHPHSEDKVSEINKRINESLLNCPYFFSTFNCENFVVYAMTGETNNICTQLDHMTTTQRLLADFLDNLIPMNLYVAIVVFLCLLFFNEYLLSSVLLVPLSKLFSIIKIRKYASSEKVPRQIVIYVSNILITSLGIYLMTFVDIFPIRTIIVLFVTVCFYSCVSVLSAIVGYIYDKYRIPLAIFMTNTQRFVLCSIRMAISFPVFIYENFRIRPAIIMTNTQRFLLCAAHMLLSFPGFIYENLRIWPAIIANKVSSSFSSIGRGLRKFISTEKTSKDKSELKNTEIHSENQHSSDGWYMYFITPWVRILCVWRFWNNHEKKE